MSGTALDHPLVRGYLRDLDAALRSLPAAQARDLREQITAHLDDALGPGASEQDVAATLSRLGSPADLAAVLGALQISSAASRYAASGREQHLARLGAAVVTLTRDMKTSATFPAPTLSEGRLDRSRRPWPGRARLPTPPPAPCGRTRPASERAISQVLSRTWTPCWSASLT